MTRMRHWLSMVKFSHSIFALPFAMQGAWLASGGVPALWNLLLIIVAAVAARSAAMAFNRLVDRRIDASNPRTAGREIPAGILSPAAVGASVLIASGIFIAASFGLNTLAGQLSPAVLAVLLGYSLVKRFSWAVHLVLGLSLALAPLGAWIAVRGNFDGDLRPILALALGVVTWVAGFDLIYSCQDAQFDVDTGLQSIPARFGKARALLMSRVLHVLTVAALLVVHQTAGLSWIYLVAILVVACLLAYEQSLVKPDDLSRVDLAFFTLNGWVGIALFLGLVCDMGFLNSGIIS